MSSVNPTITYNATPAVSISSSTVSYDQIRQSLGDYCYFVDDIYFNSTLLNQLKQVYQFQIYDVNGNKKFESFTPSPDPYQYQKSIFYKSKDLETPLILNGQSNFNFTLDPNVTLQVIFFCERIAKRDALDLINPSNFLELESAMGRYKFFDKWQKTI